MRKIVKRSTDADVTTFDKVLTAASAVSDCDARRDLGKVVSLAAAGAAVVLVVQARRRAAAPRP